MAFHFSLDALLRMWRSREKFERIRLETLATKIQRLRNEIEAAEEASLQSRRNVANSLAEGASGSQIQFAALCVDGQRRFRELMEKQIEQLTRQLEAQRKVLEHAHQQREILDNLRSRQLDAYRLEETRKMQQEVDELFLSRRGFRTID
ncbi:MAG TPA: flagellar FliJ family protein [Candidatus Aquilonibacter sp.]|nr:flagellar FliJ family protein [Candidatus Aquilonibacter sp.]